MEISESRIDFYRAGDAYGEFSNFFSRTIYIDGVSWPTTEHYFQGLKFTDDPDYMEEIRRAKNARTAASLGRSRAHPLREDWEEVKDDVMYVAVKAKFSQHQELKDLLLSTGEARLVEHTGNDAYWGDGGDGSGRNMLGLTLMRVRDELREEIEKEEADA